MAKVETNDMEKIILNINNAKRDKKKKDEIKKDISKIKEETKIRLEELKKTDSKKIEKMTKAEKEKFNEEISLLENNMPYKSYMRLLKSDEIDDFCDIKKPENQFHIILEETNLRPDKMYFWLLDFITTPSHLKFKNVIKTEDSVVFGAMSQYGTQYLQVRGGKQQVAQSYLKTISEVMRSLFPLLYEIKQSDELLSVYEAAKKIEDFKTYNELEDIKNKSVVESAFAAERLLRDKWASEVDGGKLFTFARPQSQQGPGYVLLPHWFFSIRVRFPREDKNENWPQMIQERLEGMAKENTINKEVSNVVGNFLLRFKIWQEESYNQLKAARKFKVSFLRQQYANIRLYIDWLKPILKTIQEMAPQAGRYDPYKNKPEQNPHIYNTLDTTNINLEFIAYNEPKENKDHPTKSQKYFQLIMVNFNHKTSSITLDVGGQNQNIPFGTNDITIKGFVWTKEQFEAYTLKQQQEEFDILESLYDSMKDVREQIEKYLKEGIDTEYAESLTRKYPEYYPETNIKKIKTFKDNVFELKGLFGPFSHVIDGFKMAFSPVTAMFAFRPLEKKEGVEKEFWNSKELDEAKGNIRGKTFVAYEIFKKAHKCTTW